MHRDTDHVRLVRRLGVFLLAVRLGSLLFVGVVLGLGLGIVLGVCFGRSVVLGRCIIFLVLFSVVVAVVIVVATAGVLGNDDVEAESGAGNSCCCPRRSC